MKVSVAERFSSLNALRAFEAAARHQELKRAAAELHVTTAAVSQQVKLLEADLDPAHGRSRANGS